MRQARQAARDTRELYFRLLLVCVVSVRLRIDSSVQTDSDASLAWTYIELYFFVVSTWYHVGIFRAPELIIACTRGLTARMPAPTI